MHREFSSEKIGLFTKLDLILRHKEPVLLRFEISNNRENVLQYCLFEYNKYIFVLNESRSIEVLRYHFWHIIGLHHKAKALATWASFSNFLFVFQIFFFFFFFALNSWGLCLTGNFSTFWNLKFNSISFFFLFSYFFILFTKDILSFGTVPNWLLLTHYLNLLEQKDAQRWNEFFKNILLLV